MPDFTDIGMHDFMAKSTVLRRHSQNRTFFDPSNEAHIASLQHYLIQGSWLQQFFPEDPYVDVPMTVMRKYIGHHLDVNVTTSQRLAAHHTVQSGLRGQDEMEAAESVQRNGYDDESSDD